MSPDHDNRGKFKAGNKVGAKSKRNKEIVAYIHEISNDLQDYIDILDGAIRNPKTKLGDKISCIKEMLDRGVKKCPKHVKPKTIIGMENVFQKK